jgi:hypothetical protein
VVVCVLCYHLTVVLFYKHFTEPAPAMWFVAITVLSSVANVALCADSLTLSGTNLAVGDTLTAFVTRAVGLETSSDWVAITTVGNVIVVLLSWIVFTVIVRFWMDPLHL